MTEGPSELAMHCSVFHPSVNCNSHLHWHLHLLLPWATGESEQQDKQPSDPVLRGEVDVAVSSVAISDSGPGLVEHLDLPSDPLELMAGMQVAAIESDSFLTSLLIGKSLRAVTGVALC